MLYREVNTVGGYLSPACGGGKITSTQFFLIDKGILQWCAKEIVIFCIAFTVLVGGAVHSKNEIKTEHGLIFYVSGISKSPNLLDLAVQINYWK